jgi:hypothetical protein
VVAATTDPSGWVWQAACTPTGIGTRFPSGSRSRLRFLDTAFEESGHLTTTQGLRPTGVYLAKDAGIVTVVARAQRGFGGIGE